MADRETDRAYAHARMGAAFDRGRRPAVLVVDLNCGSTDRAAQHGMDLDAEVAATRRVLEAARAGGHRVIFTTNAYEPNLQDAGIWLRKLPSLRVFTLGSPESEIDPRLARRDDETLIVKKAVSPFFGTNLATLLAVAHADTVILTGSTTSGCIRAAAIDLVQHGYPTLVPRECVGDRARAPHEANLFDIQAKYADVVATDDVLTYLASLPPTGARSA